MWNNILLQNDFGQDETINFGPRKEESKGKNVYESHTLATIACSEKIRKNPNVICCATTQHIVVTVDSEILVFDGKCSELVCTLKYESEINVVALNENNPILVVGEQSGLVHLIHIPYGSTLPQLRFISRDCINEFPTFKSIFFSAEDENGHSQIVILCKMNQLFLLSQVHTKNICHAIENGNKDELLKVLSDIVHKDINLSVDHSDFEMKCMFPIFGLGDMLILGTFGIGDTVLGIELQDEKFCSVMPKDCFEGEILKVQSAKSGRYILVLDDKKQLYIICRFTLIIKNKYDNLKVEDFFLLENKDAQKTDSRLATLTFSESDLHFQIHSFPNLDCIYTLHLTDFAALVFMPSVQESVYVIEGVKESECDEFISSLRIKNIEDASSERRLSHLINRRKFEEAESFANVFGLDVEVVHKARLKYYIETVSPWKTRSSEIDLESVLSNIKSIFKKIRDKEHVIRCCLQAALPSLPLTYQLLLYAKDNCNSVGSHCIEELTKEINCNLTRLISFQLLYKEEQWKSWFEFSKANLMDVFLHLMSTNKIEKAFYLWERHQDELGLYLNMGTVDKILECIPTTWPSVYLVHWFKDTFVPNVLHNSSNGLEVLAKWLIERVQLMEITENSNWPHNGITLLESLPFTFDELFHLYNKGSLGISSKLNLHIMEHQVTNPSSYISQLLCLVEDLEKLAVLQTQFSCKLSLSEFQSEDKTSVVYMILDRLSGEKIIKSAITDFLHSYMRKYELMEKIFVNYIEEILRFSQYNWWYWEEAIWEERVIAIISCIQDENCKMDAMIHAISHAPLPWSSGIQKIYNEGLAISDTRRKDFEIQKQLIKLKQVLIKYELRNYNITDVTGAESLVRHILRLDGPTAMTDALDVINSYSHLSDIDAYLFRMKYLLEMGRQDDFADLISEIPVEKAIICCKRLMLFAMNAIQIFEDTALFNDQDEQNYALNLKLGVIYLVRYLQRTSPDKKFYYEHDFKTFLRSTNFQIEYGFCIKWSHLESKEHCNNILQEEIDNFFSSGGYFENFPSEKRPAKQKKGFNSIFRLGELLGFENHEVVEKFALKAIQIGKSDVAIELVNMLPSICNKHSSEVTFSVVDYLLENIKIYAKDDNKIGDLPDVLHNLLSQSLAYCEPKMIQKHLDYCHWTSLLSSLHRVAKSHNFQTNLQTMDHYYHQKLVPSYCDRGLRFSSSQVIPHAVNCLMYHLSSKSSGDNLTNKCAEKNLQELFNSGTVLIKTLKEKHHEETALSVVAKLLVAYMDVFTSTKSLKETDMNANLQQYWDRNLLKDISSSLLSRIISSRHPDLSLAMGVLYLLQRTEAKIIIKELGKGSSDFKRLQSVASLGMRYGQENNLPEITAKCKEYQIRAVWGQRLLEQNIPYDKIQFPAHLQVKNQLLTELVQKFHLSIEIVQEFCHTFDLQLDDAMIIYLEGIFLKPDVTNIMYCEDNSLHISRKRKEIFSQADKVINCVENKILLLNNLITIVDKVDFYSYEVLLFLKEHIKKLLSLDEKMKSTIENDIELLNFSQNYQRISLPTDYETSSWLSLYPQYKQLPEIAYKRLPFHLLARPEVVWKVIDNELSFATVRTWLEVSSLIKISSDDLLVVTLQKTVTAWINNHKDITPSAMWNSHLPDSRLFSIIFELFNQINCSDKAIACASWIVKELPHGSAKMIAAKVYLDMFAEKSVKTSKDKSTAKTAIQKLYLMFHKLATEDVLHSFGLNKSEYLALYDKPEELITCLWKDIDNNSVLIGNSKVIHQTCKSIAELNKLDISKIYCDLVMKFLIPVATNLQNMDETFTFNFNVAKFSDYNDEEEMNLLRACHLLRQHIPEHCMFLLLNKAVKDESVTNIHRTRILHCLLSVLDIETLSDKSGYQSSTLLKLTKTLYCLAELEHLNIPCTVHSFENADKRELVEAVLTYNGHYSKALQFASSLCLEYKLHETNLWSVILKNMRKIGMYDDLKKLLELLGGNALLWNNEEYIETWKYILFSPFRSGEMGNRNEEQLLEVFRMILRCPCIPAIDLEAISEEFQTHKLPVPALATLLLQQRNKEQAIKKFLKVVPTEVIQNELKRMKKLNYNLTYFTQVYQFLKSHSARNAENSF